MGVIGHAYCVMVIAIGYKKNYYWIRCHWEVMAGRGGFAPAVSP